MKFFTIMIYIILIVLPQVIAFPKRIHLGGLFSEDDPSQKAFTLSINAVNKMRHNSEDLANVFFVPKILTISDNLFDVSQDVCSLVSEVNTGVKTGVAGIFGPNEPTISQHVQSICDTLDIPNIIAQEIIFDRFKTINFYPSAETLSLVYVKLVTELKWESFTIVYDTSDALARMHLLLKKWDHKGFPVTVRHVGDDPNYRPVLKEIKDSEDEHIVIDVSFNILGDVLLQAQQVGLISDKYKIIICSLDFQTMDLEPYQYSGVNITGIRIVDPNDADSIEIFNEYLFDMGLEDLSKMRTEWALMFDAVQLFARAFKHLKEAVKGSVRSLDCDGLDSWEHGTSLGNFIFTAEMKGLTGYIKFHTNRLRSDFQLDIVRLKNTGLKSVGRWNSSVGGVEWYSEPVIKLPEREEDLANKTFIVLISLLDPYNMLTASADKEVGNDRYEGYAIDLIKELSKILHFNYTFVEQYDKATGNPDPKTGKWSGMLGKVIDGEVDLAITDIAITADREAVVDFSMPWMNLGISILYKKPKKAPPSLFSFLTPISAEVWVYLSAAYILSSLCLYIIGRMCPAEWTNPYPCIEEPEELENQFTLHNCFFFTIGSILQQGSENAPLGLSTRMMATSWYFFCLIITSSYTANLAAFLTVDTIVEPIKSAEDLANLNGEIKYGAKKGGATFRFFENYANPKGSNYSTFAKMYQYMKENADDVLETDNDRGRDRVIKEEYAYLMESTAIEYITQRYCDLAQVGKLLDNKGYGIAMRKHFPYRNRINEALLNLQESGTLTQLKKKWWQDKRGGGKCNEKEETSATTALTLDHVGGVFLVLGVGLAFSALWVIIEMIWQIAYTCYKEHLPFKRELMKEVKFILKFKETVKPVKQSRKTSSNSLESTEGSLKEDQP